MERDPFKVLGVSEDVTQNDLYDAYKKLRNEYSDKRFEEGAVGADACAKLEEIETAYQDANEILKSRYKINYTGDNLDSVDGLLKDGKFDEAQAILDNCQNRTAQWHYYQAAIFYKKNWYADAIKQLDFACSMDPNNPKYVETRKTIQDKIDATTATKRASYYNTDGTAEEGGQRRTYNGGPRSESPSMCDCCSSLICADCCCECMGGDLISCC